MTLSEAFRKGNQILKKADIDAPAIDAGVLLCLVAKCSREDLYVNGDYELDERLLQSYLSALERRSHGYPLQYLTGTQEFMSLSFSVGHGVLIPRQETELLVETVLEFCTDTSRCNRILDMGTGSGCIAVSLAFYLPGCAVVAVDKSKDALDIVKKNAHMNGVGERVATLQSDLFMNVEMKASSTDGFDVIVSNPPYIRSADICGLQREVREHEPIDALDGGSDGLFFYREIIRAAPFYLNEGGMLAFEVGYDQAEDVAKLMSGVTGASGASGAAGASNASDASGSEKGPSAGFSSIRIHKDLAGIDRVVTGVKA